MSSWVKDAYKESSRSLRKNSAQHDFIDKEYHLMSIQCIEAFGYAISGFNFWQLMLSEH